ncbi:hypothetical protein ACFV9C_09320 [Kribbella sp. NPDC059898]|uniref:hypothetical protein n=1 Tax=Kribbella sp. NPDC059898 TaxID=3346995 RepID=UPI0036632A52
MEYADFDAERRRIIRAWGTEITEPEQLADAVRQLREPAASVAGRAAGTAPGLAEVRVVVAERLVMRVEHHTRIDTSLTDADLTSPATVSASAAETMVASSTIPTASRPAAVQATTTVLTEAFDELPDHLATWQSTTRDIPREATSYGAALGDRTLAAIRTFEHHPPAPAPDLSTTRFATDPALPQPQAVPSATQPRMSAGSQVPVKPAQSYER